jgi:hypothetical protein
MLRQKFFPYTGQGERESPQQLCFHKYVLHDDIHALIKGGNNFEKSFEVRAKRNSSKKKNQVLLVLQDVTSIMNLEKATEANKYKKL